MSGRRLGPTLRRWLTEGQRRPIHHPFDRGMRMFKDDRKYSPAGVAFHRGCSADTVLSAIHNGELAAEPIYGASKVSSWAVLGSDIKKWEGPMQPHGRSKRGAKA